MPRFLPRASCYLPRGVHDVLVNVRVRCCYCVVVVEQGALHARAQVKLASKSENIDLVWTEPGILVACCGEDVLRHVAGAFASRLDSTRLVRIPSYVYVYVFPSLAQSVRSGGRRVLCAQRRPAATGGHQVADEGLAVEEQLGDGVSSGLLVHLRHVHAEPAYALIFMRSVWLCTCIRSCLEFGVHTKRSL